MPIITGAARVDQRRPVNGKLRPRISVASCVSAVILASFSLLCNETYISVFLSFLLDHRALLIEKLQRRPVQAATPLSGSTAPVLPGDARQKVEKEEFLLLLFHLLRRYLGVPASRRPATQTTPLHPATPPPIPPNKSCLFAVKIIESRSVCLRSLLSALVIPLCLYFTAGLLFSTSPHQRGSKTSSLDGDQSAFCLFCRMRPEMEVVRTCSLTPTLPSQQMKK